MSTDSNLPPVKSSHRSGSRQSPFTLDEFVSSFSRLDPHTTSYVNIGGRLPLPIRALPKPGSNKLVVLFHGAVDRAHRKLPAFLDFRHGAEQLAHQLAIADPTLALSRTLSNTWFCGSHLTPLQLFLPEFFNHLQRALGIDRMVFMGSSGGGFGALFNSFHVPKSVAVVTVPQTNVMSYYERRREEFLKTCWPDFSLTDSRMPILDLADLYSQPSQNAIVYIQSTLDTFHLKGHMVPFVKALHQTTYKRLSLKCSYWGKPKHSGAVPLQEWDGWLHAVLNADSIRADDIISSYFNSGVEMVPSAAISRLEQTKLQKSALESASPERKSEINNQDLLWTDLITKTQMNK